MNLRAAFEMIWKAKTQMGLAEYIKIWGEHLGNHIWFQEGSDIIRIWKSGLTIEQQEALMKYIKHNYGEQK